MKRWRDSTSGPGFSRGRSYARRGQALSIEVRKGEVSAAVQGSRPRPYRVKICVRTLDESEWERLAEFLRERPVFIAQLLAGRMPEEIEDTFRDVGLSLFPDRRSDLETDCSCPDWSNPCKHIAAVYLLLGEEFDRDPFLIFRLRGMERDRLVGLFDSQAAANGTEVPGSSREYFHGQSSDDRQSEPLPVDPEEFWGGGDDVRTVHGLGSSPTVSAALPKRLGTFPSGAARRTF